MKDLDTLLADRGNPKPRRPLRADFTHATIEHIKAHPRPAGLFTRIKENLSMKFHQPATAIAAAIITLIIGGTVYAVAQWPTIHSVFQGETSLPSGNRIVAIDTENCQYYGKPEAGKIDKSSLYYEIKQGATLTNDEVVAMIKGICEENVANDVAQEVSQQVTKDTNGLITSPVLHVKDIAADKITVELDPHYDLTMRYGGTFAYPFSPGVKAYDGKTLTKLGSIKPGDSVMLVVRDKHASGSEGDANDPNHWDDPELMSVLAVVRVPALSGSPDAFYKHLGKDFVRTERCTTNPSGFCRAYEFDK